MRHTDRFRLKIYVLLAAMVIITMLISLSLSYFLSYDQQEKQLQVQMLQTVQDKAAHLGEWLNGKIAILDIADAMRHQSEAPFIPKEVLAAHGVSDVYEGRSDGSFFSITRWQPPPGFDPRVRPWYQTIAGRDSLSISDPYLDLNTGLMAVSLGRPTDAPHEITAILAADIPIQVIVEQIARLEFSDMGFVWIINERGRFVFHPDPRVIYQDIHNVEAMAGLPELITGVRSGESRYKHQGDWHRALFSAIPYSEWTLGVTVLDDHALIHLSRLKTIYLVLSLVLSLVFMVLAYFMTRILAAPLISIINFVRGVTGGKLDQRLEIHFNKELDELAGSLNEMTLRLRENFTQIEAQKTALAQNNLDLEQQIEARTHDLKEAYQRLEEAYETTKTLAATDPLTGIANRRNFFEQAEKEVSRSMRENHPLSVLQLDLDNFKAINDTHGHAAGDAVLIHATRKMQDCLRLYDLLGRLGGEEFAILLPATPLEEACQIGERIRQKIASSYVTHDDQRIPLSVSIGVSHRAICNEHIEKLLSEADCALYAAKTKGKNRVEAFCAPSDSPG